MQGSACNCSCRKERPPSGGLFLCAPAAREEKRGGGGEGEPAGDGRERWRVAGAGDAWRDNRRRKVEIFAASVCCNMCNGVAVRFSPGVPVPSIISATPGSLSHSRSGGGQHHDVRSSSCCAGSVLCVFGRRARTRGDWSRAGGELREAMRARTGGIEGAVRDGGNTGFRAGAGGGR